MFQRLWGLIRRWRTWRRRRQQLAALYAAFDRLTLETRQRRAERPLDASQITIVSAPKGLIEAGERVMMKARSLAGNDRKKGWSP